MDSLLIVATAAIFGVPILKILDVNNLHFCSYDVMYTIRECQASLILSDWL